MPATHYLPHAIHVPDGFPEGFFEAPDGLYCTILRHKSVIERRQRIASAIWARRYTRSGLLVLDSPRLPCGGLRVSRHAPIHEIGLTLHRLGIMIAQDCLFDIQQWVALVEPNPRSGWIRKEIAA